MCLVYVLTPDDRPLMPCVAVIARLLLKAGKAQESPIQLWQKHENELKKAFWKERTFWSDGYFCCTIGNASQETIRQYIESQGESAAFIHETEDLVVFSPCLYKVQHKKTKKKRVNGWMLVFITQKK